MTGPAVQRIDGAILLQGPVLAELRWLLWRGVREIWRADSLHPSPAIDRLLSELPRAATTSGVGNIGSPPLDDSPDFTTTEQIGTTEAAQMLNISPRQVRYLADRLGGHKVGHGYSFPLAAIQEEAISRRGVGA
jgi:hypothetical protein